MNVVVESSRDQRVLVWLVERVGEEAVAEACRKLAGARRAYPSNIAKVLRLSPPAELALTTREEAQRHLAAIRALLHIPPSSKVNGDGEA